MAVSQYWIVRLIAVAHLTKITMISKTVARSKVVFGSS
ncbi:MAG: hypothetical protein JETT_2465 [Candidatus Jettenia ecosi]|uniref:Uncharacterized protein n=1 Tax=Candidatus Jettenia ecosi TaxID=2494326 RepID=A0A533QEZ8_9BACT|nr:MAG: hypothetical protein JETT_2465 [Candidatus Jettenia ecosi]